MRAFSVALRILCALHRAVQARWRARGHGTGRRCPCREETRSAPTKTEIAHQQAYGLWLAATLPPQRDELLFVRQRIRQRVAIQAA